MKRNHHWKNFLTQFSYDHKKVDDHIVRIRRSAGELSRMLEQMDSKGVKRGK